MVEQNAERVYSDMLSTKEEQNQEQGWDLKTTLEHPSSSIRIIVYERYGPCLHNLLCQAFALEQLMFLLGANERCLRSIRRSEMTQVSRQNRIQ